MVPPKGKQRIFRIVIQKNITLLLGFKAFGRNSYCEEFTRKCE